MFPISIKLSLKRKKIWFADFIMQTGIEDS